ncbi:nickel-dependent hydrogenase large subunit [Halodesulfurarchaeum formicicum]|uniref:Ni/Fe-hydrogenase large subunit n=1 Tax=Halodesulfurarchaeum formicicum TaxID=1873524 RepID=A0A1J1ABM9_9EURY|nr:nickel-dependent hydrogenase large subunit [Halodesulfurarchaeum formicicum]APE95143.1 Ni/Fe-hydrogenase large subunit [Halodesulfurarchaeum formicicum]
MPEIDIDPTTRIEGHHGITLQVDADGTVTEAKSKMEMFRGAEIVTLGRPPSDAPQITGMVCGVCFLCHRFCSSKAAEDAALNAEDVDFGGPPANAVRLRDTVEGIFYLWNHAVHLFALVGPDYSDAVAGTGFDRLDPLEGDGYMAAMANQRKVMKALAEFGGRAPHPVAYVPGGLATRPDVSTIQAVKSRVQEVSNWLGATENVPQVIENVQNGEFDPALGEGLHDIVSIILAAAEAGAADIGQGPDRFYSNGMFEDPESGELFLKRGVYRNGSAEELTKQEIIDGITEDTEYSWYTDDSGGAPTDAKPPEPAPEKDQAYSWGKAPRFEGQSMEVGPLARMTITGLDPFDLRATLGGGAAESNTLNRLIARAQETLVVRDQIMDWLDAIDPSEPFMADDWSDDFTGKGVGLMEASRGALSHYMDIENGEIERYQIITPTIWNLGPRDGSGQPSPLEEGVVGDVVSNVESPLTVLRTIRSMDPCLACSVHVQSPENASKTEVEPVTPSIGGGSCDI